MIIEEDNVIVHKIDDDHCQVIPPTDKDTPAMAATRLFLLACLHRRNLEAGFEDEMRQWISSYEPEEFRRAVNAKAKYRMDN